MTSLVGVLILTSCGPAATLYTDPIFRQAAPEISQAWRSLSPWKNVRIEDLPAGAGLPALQADLTANPAGAVLVGVILSDSDRSALEAAFPQTRFLFFPPVRPSPGTAVFAVRRVDAWLTVARQAVSPGTAAVVFPSDASPEEIREFEQGWKQQGGGTLVTAAGFRTGLFDPQPSAVFHWGGAEADAPVQALPASVPVHGNPGTARTAGASGLTWTVKRTGLGDFLQSAALEPEKKTHFLPLETVLDRR